jgi:hypothetical protein
MAEKGEVPLCVSVWQHDRVEFIVNQGNRMTSLYVAFTDSERLISYAAKRLIGRSYTKHIKNYCNLCIISPSTIYYDTNIVSSLSS